MAENIVIKLWFGPIVGILCGDGLGYPMWRKRPDVSGVGTTSYPHIWAAGYEVVSGNPNIWIGFEGFGWRFFFLSSPYLGCLYENMG